MSISKRQLIITLLLAATAVLAACQAPVDGPETAVSPAEQAGAAPQQDDAVEISNVLAEGEVVPSRYTTLSFQIGGPVTEVLVEEGQQVAAGDTLVTVDAVDLQINLNQANARLQSAQSALSAAESRQAVAAARVNSAELQVSAAEAQLALTEAGPRPEQIAAAESRVAAAAAQVSSAVGRRDTQLNIGTDSAIESARAEVIAAQAQVDALQSRYDDIINACFDTPDGEICPLYGPIEEQTRAQLEAARAGAEAARAQLQQLQAGATAGQRQAANGGVIVAQAQQRIAEAQLDLLQSGSTPEQIRQAEVAVEQAEANVEGAAAGVVQADAAVTQAAAQVTAAEAAVRAAEAALDRATLTAPYDGIIGRINVNEGEFVGPGQPVTTIADLSDWLVETTDLTELDIARVEVGSQVEVSFDAIPEETLTGEVTNISLVSELSQGDVVYEVTVRLNDTDGLPIRWGMTTFIDINN